MTPAIERPWKVEKIERTGRFFEMWYDKRCRMWTVIEVSMYRGHQLGDASQDTNRDNALMEIGRRAARKETT